MAPDAARRATEHEFPPACPFCNRHDRVEPLAVSDLSPGVQDHRCAHCGFVWATRGTGDDASLLT